MLPIQLKNCWIDSVEDGRGLLTRDEIRENASPFALLQCMVMATRGTRGKKFDREEMDVGEISFNLIPEESEND